VRGAPASQRNSARRRHPLAAALAAALVLALLPAGAVARHAHDAAPHARTTKKEWCGKGPDCRATPGSARAFLRHARTHRPLRTHAAAGRRRVRAHAAQSGTYAETTGGPAHTWTNYTNAGGEEGQLIAEHETVQIACRVKGFRVEDGDEWWYLIAGGTWNYGYYVSADPFYNDGQTEGSLIGTPLVDESVPECGAGEGTPETTGGEAHTWSNYGDAGGTKGMTIGGHATVRVNCKVLGLAVADGNTWWYRISQAPWNNAFYASADAFYNNGQSSGSLAGTPFVDETVPTCPEPSEDGATAETAGGEAHTWSNYADAGGDEGPVIEAHQIIQIECKLQGFAVADGNTWWYRIKQAPWKSGYYVSADAFYNGVPATGSLIGTPYVDGRVPTCPSGLRPGEEMTGGEAHTWANYSHAGAAQGPTIRTSTAVAVSCRVQGWAAPDGNTWWYLVASAPWNNVYYVSADAFYNGAPPTGNLKGTPFVDPSIPVCVGNHEAPIASAVGYGHAVVNSPGCTVVKPVDCASGDFWHAFTDVAIAGRGPGLRLTRTYNSLNATNTGLFGNGWSSSLDQHMTSTEGGTELVTLDDGSEITAVPAGSGGYTIPASADATLQHNNDGTYTLTEHATSRLTFSAAGKLLAISDLDGNTTSLTYSGGQLASAIDAAGRALTLTLANGRVKTVTDPLGRSTNYEYDSEGNLTAVTGPAGRTWRFKYDEAHRLTRMTDARGGNIQNEYDTQGRVAAQTDAAGLTTRFAYTGDNFSPLGGTTTVTDPHGNSVIEQYDNGFLMQITKAAGTAAQSTASYTYDPSTLGITSTTDGNGHTSHTVYDAAGQPTSTTDALGNTTTNSYNQLQEVVTSTTPLGHTTTRTYDQSGNPTSVTGPEGDTTRYEHADPAHPGDVSAIIDPEGRTETLTYDSYGDIATRSQHPREGASDTTAYSYDTDGELTCEAPPNATAQGVACATSGPRNPGTATNSYNPDGQISASTDPAGHTTSRSYDTDGNQTETVDPAGNRTLTSYDLDSRVISKTTAAGTSFAATIKHAYDIANATGACQGVANTSYCESTTDPNGGETTSHYDAHDQLIATARPGGSTTRYSYDPAGNRATLTDAQGRTTTYLYDAANYQTGIQYSDGATPNVEYVYDADGNRETMRDGTGTGSYQYDNAGRLTSLKDGSGAHTTYEYDKAGKIATITYPNGKTITRTYDGAGRLETITDWLGHTTTFNYDANGNPTSTTYPNGDTVSSSYSATNTVSHTGVADGSTVLAAISYQRNEDDLVSKESDQNLVGITTYAYDAKNQLIAGGGKKFAYDAAGNPTTLAAAHQTYNAEDEIGSSTTSTVSTGFSDDPQGERTEARPSHGLLTRYRYDQAGRLTEAAKTARPPVVRELIPSSGPLTGGITVKIKGQWFGSATAVMFGGAPATDVKVSSTKLITAKVPAGQGTVDVRVTTPIGTSPVVSSDRFTYGGETPFAAPPKVESEPVVPPAARYSYNGDGLRMSSATGSVVSRHTWDITPEVPEITSDASNSYIYGPDGLPIEQITQTGATSYFFHDATGSTRGLLDSTGALAATFSYNPYGTPRKGTGSARTPILFAGGYTDETTGLVYLVHRYYDPATAQFITLDPALVQTEAPYTYAQDDPANAVDPSGLWSACFGICVGNSGGNWGVGFGLGFSAGGVGSFSVGTRAVYYPRTGVYSWGADYPDLGGIDIEEQGGRITSVSICAGVNRIKYFSLCTPSGGGGSSPAYPDPYQNLHPDPLQLFRPPARTTSAIVTSRCATRYSA
jgi:RHS repeat-associated protein